MSMTRMLLFGFLFAACAASRGPTDPAPMDPAPNSTGGTGGSGGTSGMSTKPSPADSTMSGGAGGAKAPDAVSPKPADAASADPPGAATDAAMGPGDPPSPEVDGAPMPAPVAKKKVIVFTHTTGYRHASIEQAAATLRTAFSAEGFEPTATADPAVFSTQALADVAAVVLVSTTGKPLGDPGTQAIGALDAFVKGGGVLIGLHAASSTLYDPGLAYTRLIGGKFETHPGGVRAARCHGEGNHPAAVRLPSPFLVRDEIYVFSSYRMDNQVVLTCEAVGGGERLPIAWFRTEGQGRVFYTALGHSDSDWSMTAPYFADHAWPGILWALGRR